MKITEEETKETLDSGEGKPLLSDKSQIDNNNLKAQFVGIFIHDPFS